MNLTNEERIKQLETMNKILIDETKELRSLIKEADEAIRVQCEYWNKVYINIRKRKLFKEVENESN